MISFQAHRTEEGSLCFGLSASSVFTGCSSKGYDFIYRLCLGLLLILLPARTYFHCCYCSLRLTLFIAINKKKSALGFEEPCLEMPDKTPFSARIRDT